MQNQSCYPPPPPRHGSKLMVRPDRSQNSQSNPAFTPSHRGKVSVGLLEPRGCGEVRIREDFTSADCDNQPLVDTQDTYRKVCFHPMPQSRGRHPPVFTDLVLWTIVLCGCQHVRFSPDALNVSQYITMFTCLGPAAVILEMPHLRQCYPHV